MRVRSPISTLVFKTFCVSTFLIISACSSNILKPSQNNDIKDKPTSKLLAKAKKATNDSLKHTHPANPCTVALEHSHVYTLKEHQHTYDCENTNEFVSNAHVHEATELNKRFRHVHPNGANKHSHHKR